MDHFPGNSKSQDTNEWSQPNPAFGYSIWFDLQSVDPHNSFNFFYLLQHYNQEILYKNKDSSFPYKSVLETQSHSHSQHELTRAVDSIAF